LKGRVSKGLRKVQERHRAALVAAVVRERRAVRLVLTGDAFFENAFFENAFFENAFFENFANFWRARSRLYQNEILQENMRSTAFFKLYKIRILLHRCNLKIFAKNRFEKTANFVKIQQKFRKCRKICKILPNFKNFSLKIWEILKNAAKRIFCCKNR
jgi:hypothetical protein